MICKLFTFGDCSKFCSRPSSEPPPSQVILLQSAWVFGPCKVHLTLLSFIFNGVSPPTFTNFLTSLLAMCVLWLTAISKQADIQHYGQRRGYTGCVMLETGGCGDAELLFRAYAGVHTLVCLNLPWQDLIYGLYMSCNANYFHKRDYYLFFLIFQPAIFTLHKWYDPEPMESSVLQLCVQKYLTLIFFFSYKVVIRN